MVAICRKCKHHRVRRLGRLPAPMDVCYAIAEKRVDFVTGEKYDAQFKLCHLINKTGECGLFEKKGIIALSETEKNWLLALLAVIAMVFFVYMTSIMEKALGN